MEFMIVVAICYALFAIIATGYVLSTKNYYSDDKDKVKLFAGLISIIGLSNIAVSIALGGFMYWDAWSLSYEGGMICAVWMVLSFFLIIPFRLKLPTKARVDKANAIALQRKENQDALAEFRTQNRVTTYVDYGLFLNQSINIDPTNREVVLIRNQNATHEKISFSYIPFSSIVSCEIVENNATVTEKGVDRAVMGGLIAGEAGAIVGAATRSTKDVCTRLDVDIILNDLTHPRETIRLIDFEIEKTSLGYRNLYDKARAIYAAVTSAIQYRDEPYVYRYTEPEPVTPPPPQSLPIPPDDLAAAYQALQQLKNQGVLSEAEYTEKLRQLLDGL